MANPRIINSNNHPFIHLGIFYITIGGRGIPIEDSNWGLFWIGLTTLLLRGNYGLVSLVKFQPLHCNDQTLRKFDPVMREFATDRLPSTTCIFSNILDLWGDPQSVEQCLGAHASFSAKVGAARSWPRYSHGWCLRHHRWCPYTNSECRVQGPPCPDWSSAGNRAGVAGKDLPTLLAGGAKMDLTQPCIGVIENSTHMPSGVVSRSLWL